MAILKSAFEGRLMKELREQFKESKELEKEIKVNLGKVGWGV